MKGEVNNKNRIVVVYEMGYSFSLILSLNVLYNKKKKRFKCFVVKICWLRLNLNHKFKCFFTFAFFYSNVAQNMPKLNLKLIELKHYNRITTTIY